MTPLFFALMSYFGWGVGDIFGTVASRKLGGFSVSVWSLAIRVVLFTLYFPFAWYALNNLTWGLFLAIYFLGSIALVGFVAFNEGLRVGNPALVGTIAAAFPLISVLIALVFLGERLTTPQALAIGVIFIGVMLTSLDVNQIKLTKSVDKGVWLGLTAMITWGIFFGFIKIPVARIGWFWPNYITYATFPLVLLYMRKRGIPLVRPTLKRGLVPLLSAISLLSVAEFSYNAAITSANTAIVAPIAGSYPTLFVVLAFLVFKDPITKQQIVGIVTTLIGIVLLSLSTG